MHRTEASAMFSGLLGFLAIGKFCYAMPTQQPVSQSINLDAPLWGFPAAELPLASNLSAGTLGKPLDPNGHRQVHYKYQFAVGNAPKGPELIANLAANIYDPWKDTANHRIRSPIQTGKAPFSNLEWTIIPNLVTGAVFTPVKVGIVACWLMCTLPYQHAWPGRIRARIWDSSRQEQYAVQTGTLDIVNRGRLSAISTNNEVGSGNTTSSPLELAALPISIEKRWLQCFSQMYWLTVSNYFEAHVADDPRIIAPDRGESVSRLPCGAPGGGPHLEPLNPGDRVVLILYPSAGAAGATPLSWDDLARSMLEWINGIAENRKRYTVWRSVMIGGEAVGRLGVVLDGGVQDHLTAVA